MMGGVSEDDRNGLPAYELGMMSSWDIPDGTTSCVCPILMDDEKFTLYVLHYCNHIIMDK